MTSQDFTNPEIDFIQRSYLNDDRRIVVFDARTHEDYLSIIRTLLAGSTGARLALNSYRHETENDQQTSIQVLAKTEIDNHNGWSTHTNFFNGFKFRLTDEGLESTGSITGNTLLVPISEADPYDQLMMETVMKRLFDPSSPNE